MKRNEIKDQIELWLADQSIPESDLPPSKSAAANKSKTEHTIAHNTMLLRKHYQPVCCQAYHIQSAGQAFSSQTASLLYF